MNPFIRAVISTVCCRELPHTAGSHDEFCSISWAALYNIRSEFVERFLPFLPFSLLVKSVVVNKFECETEKAGAMQNLKP